MYESPSIEKLPQSFPKLPSNNYSPQWLVVEIYHAVKQCGKYPPLATEMNSCFSTY